MILEKERGQELFLRNSIVGSMRVKYQNLPLNTYQASKKEALGEPSPPLHVVPEEGASDQEQVQAQMENQQADVQFQNQIINFNAKTAVNVDNEKMRIILANAGITDRLTQDKIIAESTTQQLGLEEKIQKDIQQDEKIPVAEILDTQLQLPLRGDLSIDVFP